MPGVLHARNKATGAWIPVSLSGPEGPQGDPGPPGVKGDPGTMIVPLPYDQWPPVDPQPNTLYLRLAP